MRERDLLIAACGVTEDGRPKAQIQIITRFVDINNSEELNIDMIQLYGPVVNIFRTMEHASVDIQFDSSSDPDFVQSIKMLQDFCKPENSLDNQSDTIPVVLVNIIPLSYEGEYYSTGMHGSWVVMPSQPNRLADTIRFIFKNEDFCSYRHNMSNFNIDELLTELKTENEE